MSAAVAVLGSGEDLELAGVSAEDAGGGVWCGNPAGAGSALAAAELCVALGSIAVPDEGSGAGAKRWVRWLHGAASEPLAVAVAGPMGEPRADPRAFAGQRVIAQAGPDLWRRAPWPVADGLFDWSPPTASAPVLVVGPDQARGEGVAALQGYGVDVAAAPRLTRAALQAAIAVVEVSVPDAPPSAWLMAPLAARRVLVRVAARPDFGLQAGIDHLAVPDATQAAALASALIAEPRAFGSLRAFGAITAERHRASTVFARMLTDVRLEEAADGRWPPNS